MNKFSNRLLNKSLLTVPFVLACVVAVSAADPKIVGETKVAPYTLVRLKVEGLDKGVVPIWKVRPLYQYDPAKPPKIDWATKSQQILYPEWVAPPGEYLVEATWGKVGQDGALILNYDESRVTIFPPGPAPTPPGPVPPGPTPPTPPAPQPAVAPIQKPGLRVLVVREADANSVNALTAGQREVILNGQVWDYLRSKTVTEATNPGGAWRILDPQTNPLTNGDPDGQTWAAALGRPRTSVPWVLISNGTRNVGYEGPLPADTNAEKFINLLKQYE